MAIVQDFIDNNEDVIIRLSRRNPFDDCDPLTETLYEGMLSEIPAKYRGEKVLSEGWLLGAQMNQICI